MSKKPDYTTAGYSAYYSLVREGGVIKCAWCKKPVEEIEDVSSHIDEHIKNKDE